MPRAEEFPRHASLDHSTLGLPKPIQIDMDQGASAVPKYPAMWAGACWKLRTGRGKAMWRLFGLLVLFFWTAIDPAIGQTQKIQIDPKIWQSTCHVAPTGSSFLGWQQSCSAYARVLDRQNSTLYECQGTANVKWDRNKAIAHNAVTAVCTPVLPAFPNATGDYDLGPVVGTSTETSSLRGLLWFVASQQDKKVAFCYKGLFGGGPVPSLTISSCGSTALP